MATRRPDIEANPSIARLRTIKENVVSAWMRMDSELRETALLGEAMVLLSEAIRVAERKHHLINKLRRSVLAKNRRIQKLAKVQP